MNIGIAEAFDRLWQTKLDLERKKRAEAYEHLYATISPNNKLPKDLYELAILSLGNTNEIRRDIIRERWDATHDESWAAGEQQNYPIFLREEQNRVAKEIADFLKKYNQRYADEFLARGAAALAESTAVHEARCPVLIQGLIDTWRRQEADRQTASHNQSRTNTRADTALGIQSYAAKLQFFSAVMILLTPAVSIYTCSKQREEFRLQNRPYLTMKRDGDPKPPSSGEKVSDVINGKALSEDAVLWRMIIKNDGKFPALQVQDFAIWMLDNKIVGRMNAAPDFQPTSLHWNPVTVNPLHLIGKNIVIAPGGTQPILFLMPKRIFRELVNTGNKEKNGVIQSGITFQVNYSAPWDKQGVRPYYFQFPLYMWNNGGDKVGYGTRSPEAN